jgi:hypothetical protein
MASGRENGVAHVKMTVAAVCDRRIPDLNKVLPFPKPKTSGF